jgi:hypothetical protein
MIEGSFGQDMESKRGGKFGSARQEGRINVVKPAAFGAMILNALDQRVLLVQSAELKGMASPSTIQQ